MTIQIRRITIADAAGYNLALGSVARERKFLRLTDALPLASSESFVASNIEQANPHLVALDDNRVIGWCDICRSESNGSDRVGALGMGLLASHRGRGIGQRLLDATLVAARPSFRRVELDVYETNLPAIRLYEKTGFIHEGRRRAAILIEGAFRDILGMALLFS